MKAKLSKLTKIIYGSGDLGFSLTATIIGAYFLFFLTDVVGLAPRIAGIAILVGKTWDYINDPLIGHISDCTRSKWGRRRPFLLFGALPFSAAFALMWYRPAIESEIGLAVYYALAYVLFDAAATFVYMPYFALTPELTADYDERTSLTSYRMFYSIFGSLLAFTIPLMIVGTFTPENAARVLLMAIIFGLASAVPLILVFFFTKEREVYAVQERPKLISSLKAAFQNRPFVLGAVMLLATWTSMSILETTLLFFIKYVVGRESQSDFFMALIFITGIVALPLWNLISKKYNKRLAYACGIAFWAAVQVVLITLNPLSSSVWMIFLCVMAGIGVSAAHVLPWSILPDAIEWGELRTGERHEGVFYSLVTLMTKVATSISIPLTALILDLTGYVPNSTIQPQSALTGIRLLVGPIPALFLMFGIVFALKYPLNREEYADVVAKLENRRGDKVKKQRGTA